VVAHGTFAIFGPALVSIALIAARIGGLVITMPLFSSHSIPHLLKAAIVGVLTLLVFLGQGPAPAVGELRDLALVAAMVTELAAGAVMGIAVSLLFAAVHFAGQLMGTQMGFAIVNVFDPVNFQQIGVVGQLLNVMGLLIFLAFDGHLMMLRALFDSFHVVPPGGVNPDSTFMLGELVRLGGVLFQDGLRLALPVTCVVLLVNVGLAVVARTVPQVNVFVIGFILTIGLGLGVLILSIPSTVGLLRGLIHQGVESSVRLSHHMGG
jgi:flagellar biosynthetic protein FliR